MQPVKRVLTGAGFSMALSGLIVLISSADRQKVDFIANWLSGNIWVTDWPLIWAILPWATILFPFTLYKANRLNLLWLSEPVPIRISVSVEKERAILLLTAVALAAVAESVTGGIAFVGLRVPHFARASSRTSKSALPAGSDSDPRLAAYHRKKHTGTQRYLRGLESL